MPLYSVCVCGGVGGPNGSPSFLSSQVMMKLGWNRSVCNGALVWRSRGVTLLSMRPATAGDLNLCQAEIAAELQRPATGNWFKGRNHGELGRANGAGRGDVTQNPECRVTVSNHTQHTATRQLCLFGV